MANKVIETTTTAATMLHCRSHEWTTMTMQDEDDTNVSWHNQATAALLITTEWKQLASQYFDSYSD